VRAHRGCSDGFVLVLASLFAVATVAAATVAAATVAAATVAAATVAAATVAAATVAAATVAAATVTAAVAASRLRLNLRPEPNYANPLSGGLCRTGTVLSGIVYCQVKSSLT